MASLDQGLPCMNCQQLVPEKDGKIFAQVFVCSVCYAVAESLHNKCEAELRRMQLLLKEAIRIALVEGKLKLGPATPLDDVPKEELLKMIVQLTENKNGDRSTRPAGR